VVVPAVTDNVTVVVPYWVVEETKEQVTVDVGLEHVLNDGVVALGAVYETVVACPVVWTTGLPVREVGWKAVDGVPNEKVAVLADEPRAAVTLTGYVPPGVFGDPVKVRLVVTEPEGLRVSCAAVPPPVNCQLRPAAEGIVVRLRVAVPL